MFDNWQKLVSSNKKLVLFMRKSLTTLPKQDEKSTPTYSSGLVSGIYGKHPTFCCSEDDMGLKIFF